MPVDDFFDASILTCGSLKYGSLAIFVACLMLGTWGTNNYVGINAREMIMLIELREKIAAAHKGKPKTREAPLMLEPLSELQGVPPPESHKALLPKLQEVPLPEPHEITVPKPPEALLPNPEVPPSEPHEALLPKLQEVILPWPPKIPLPEPHEALLLQEVTVPKLQETFQPKLQAVPLPKPDQASQPKLQQTLQQKPQEVPQPKLHDVSQPKIQEVPLVRLSKRDDQLVSNVSQDSTPDPNCTGPCAKNLDMSMETLTDENVGRHEVNLDDVDIVLQAELHSLSSETEDESPNLLSNIKQKFLNLSLENGDVQNLSSDVQNLSSGNVEFPLMPGEKLQLQQQYIAPNSSTNQTATNMNKSAAMTESDEVAYDNLMNKSQGSFAAAGIFAVAWVASIYGLISMATGIQDLLIAPSVMFVVASIACVAVIFVDMGVFETSGFFAGIIYFLLLLGAVLKVLAAVLFLYCYFVVFGYYKELRDGPSEPQANGRPSPPRPAPPPRPAQSPPKPPRSPPKPAQSPPKPAPSPPKPAQSPPKPVQSPPKPAKSPPPRPPPPSPKKK